MSYRKHAGQGNEKRREGEGRTGLNREGVSNKEKQTSTKQLIERKKILKAEWNNKCPASPYVITVHTSVMRKRKKEGRKNEEKKSRKQLRKQGSSKQKKMRKKRKEEINHK